MNKDLILFFENTHPNYDGKYLHDIRNWSDLQLEENHRFIQWMFPNREASTFNSDAPLLDDETVEAFRSRNDLKYEVSQNLERMISFYQLNDESGDRPWWVTKGNHNYLRITRILNSLREFEMFDEATDFFDKLANVYFNNRGFIGRTTFDFWEKAYTGELDE